ncbi:hypothetical protein [Primorskyibacter sp. S87]|uniref:hypothetical protein n=1 Tax=Primorskyibacter sp. S87 TaxID=3415126 RepID=UPI003C79A0D5
MNFVPRDRKRPVDRKELYGDFSSDMIRGSDYFARTVDCAAYLHITGCFPSHLRAKRTAILRQISERYPHPTSADGRGGEIRLKKEAVRGMQIESHPMVKTVRAKVSQGFKIQQSLGHNTRRGHSKIFMYQIDPETQSVVNQITVVLSGAVKNRWD